MSSQTKFQSPNRCEHRNKVKDHILEEKNEYTGEYGGGDRYQVYYCRDCDSNVIELIEPE